MDPDETLRLMRHAAKKGDWEYTIEFGAYLVDWLQAGGFRPKELVTTKKATREVMGLSTAQWRKVPKIWQGEFRKLVADLS